MKYMGSKSRISKHIVPIIQYHIDSNNIENYLELFVGGANIIDKIECKNKIGNDICKPLIGLLKHMQNDGVLPEEVTKEEYSEVRSNPENFANYYVGCVGFLASYNGRYFDGGYAKTRYKNTKNGPRLRDYYQESKNNIIKQSQQILFKDVSFECNSYQDYIINHDLKKYVIYCDPPYANTKQFANSKNFNHSEFWDQMRKLSENNIVLISELDAPSDFECIWQHEINRSIKATEKNKVTEKLFIFYKD